MFFREDGLQSAEFRVYNACLSAVDFMPTLIETVDLFCGAGGLTCGLAKTRRIDVRCGVDIDPSCEFPYTSNNKSLFLLKRIEDITAAEVLSYFSEKKPKLLAGCAPCQTFSRYYNPQKKSEDSRWKLLLEFGRLVSGVQPEFVTMENVPNLRKYDVFRKFVGILIKNGYFLWYDVVDCSAYGLPQRRRRLVLLASKYGNISLLSPEETYSVRKNVKEAIGDLEPLEAGGTSASDPLHRCRNLTALNLRRIRHTSEGGSWREWPSHLVLRCHKDEHGKTFGSIYGRMKWLTPSPTITTQFFGLGNGRFGHPEQDRAISLREGAILQGFPDNYQFVSPATPLLFKHVGRLIGNAVPVRLGEVIGMSFVHHLQQHHKIDRKKRNVKK